MEKNIQKNKKKHIDRFLFNILEGKRQKCQHVFFQKQKKNVSMWSELRSSYQENLTNSYHLDPKLLMLYFCPKTLIKKIKV